MIITRYIPTCGIRLPTSARFLCHSTSNKVSSFQNISKFSLLLLRRSVLRSVSSSSSSTAMSSAGIIEWTPSAGVISRGVVGADVGIPSVVETLVTTAPVVLLPTSSSSSSPSSSSVSSSSSTTTTTSTTSSTTSTTPLFQKLHGYEWYRSIGSPVAVAAPMVDQSELPFRMLCKELGAQLTFTPMIHARMTLTNENHLPHVFSTTPSERPVIAQFCGNEPQILLEACRKVEDFVDAVDLNLGCPQNIAKRGKYGAFLLEQTSLLEEIVQTLHVGLKVPVTCKIRLLPSIEDTIKLARALEAKGCSMLTVHGRTKKDIKQFITVANWEKGIATVRASVNIPVIANGGIACVADIENCVRVTGCDGAMTSEALLENPSIFHTYGTPSSSSSIPASEFPGLRKRFKYSQFDLCRRYLELVDIYPGAHWGIVRAHIFKFLFGPMRVMPELRSILTETVKTVHDAKLFLSMAEKRYVIHWAPKLFRPIFPASSSGSGGNSSSESSGDGNKEGEVVVAAEVVVGETKSSGSSNGGSGSVTTEQGTVNNNSNQNNLNTNNHSGAVIIMGSGSGDSLISSALQDSEPTFTAASASTELIADSSSIPSTAAASSSSVLTPNDQVDAIYHNTLRRYDMRYYSAPISAELDALYAQWSASKVNSPSSAWTEPDYLLDPGVGGSWYMRYRPEAYEGRKAPASTPPVVGGGGGVPPAHGTGNNKRKLDEDEGDDEEKEGAKACY